MQVVSPPDSPTSILSRFQQFYWVVIVVLGLFLYLPTINLLLFWDDIPHMQWLATQPNGSYWFTSENFPFYRPSTFMVWEILEAIFGYHSARALHLVSISLHILNALLVGFVGRKLTDNASVGFIASLIFVCFPFSYQTVIPTPAHFHLWTVFGLMSIVLLLIKWLENESHWFLILAWMLGFWTIFHHENGVLTPILLLGILVCYQFPDIKWRKIFNAIAPIGVFATLYFLMWLFVPKSNDSSGLVLGALDVKIGQTLQAVGFPIAAIFEHIFSPGNPTLLTWISGGIMIGVALWFFIRQKSYPLALALLWIPLVMLPAWLLLDIDYLLGSPRPTLYSLSGYCMAFCDYFISCKTNVCHKWNYDLPRDCNSFYPRSC